MQDVAARIVSSYFDEPVKRIEQIVGKGSVNCIFLVETEAHQVVVRLQRSAHALSDFHKETWCIQQAQAHGVPGPTVLSTGIADGCSYMIESFIAGKNGEDSELNDTYIWYMLGRYRRTIESINVTGYGEMLSDSRSGQFIAPKHDRFDGTWPGFVQYNINSLTDGDPLLDLGVFTRAQSRMIQHRFTQLLHHPFSLGLNHGDLSLKNTVVPPNGMVHLLDWGSAEVAVSPHFDIIQILQCMFRQDHPSPAEFRSFLEGFGLSKAQYQDLEPELHGLMLLRAIDKLRWAIERSPNSVDEYARYTEMLVQRSLSQKWL